MPAYKAPSEETLIAIHDDTRARLYAWLADCPLYVAARVIAPDRNLTGNRRSFYLGFVIEDQRLANGQDRYNLPAGIVEWAQSELRNVYPSHAVATGMTAAEVADMKREQAAKRRIMQK